jgi:hypothetical protein
MRWPRPEAGWLDGRGHSAHRPRPVWLAPWGEPAMRSDVSHESARAYVLRQWVATPIWEP